MKKNDKNKQKELDDFRKSLESTTQKDFDGHSEFSKLTPRQKLQWLSELMYFKYLASKKSKK